MKKRLSFLLLVLFSFCFCFSAFAHSGNTDANGGHRDNNNVSGLGYYHYHHGYPAHLHTGGVCPYKFDDKTGSLGGTTKQIDSLKNQVDSLKRTNTNLIKENVDLENINKRNLEKIKTLESTISDKNFYIYGLILLTGVTFLFYLSARADKKAVEQKLKALMASKDNDVALIKAQYADKEKVYISNIEALTNRKVSSSTLYVKISPNSTVYHRVNCNSASKSSITIPIYEVPTTFVPCKVCCPPKLEETSSKEHLDHSTNYLRWR